MLDNARWERFCLEYVKSGNGLESYKKAGYKCKNDNIVSANVTRLLKNASIKERLEELQKEIESEEIATAAEVQRGLTRIFRMQETEDVLVTELVDGVATTHAIQKRPQIKDVIRAGELLLRVNGAFLDKVKVDIEPVMIINDLEE